MKLLVMALLVLSLTGCSATLRTEPDLLVIDRSKLPPPDLNLVIPGLGPCTDGGDRTVQLDADQPVVVLVHGCLGSAGRFRALSQVFAWSGQQTVCFSYNDRDSMMKSSAQLASSLEALAGQMRHKKMTLIGHSQGGLVARKALVAERPGAFRAKESELRLVTISAPYAGIRAANHCASTLSKVLTLGLTVPLCKLVSGDKWHEITHASKFIREPGTLLSQVGDHLKIDTDENGTCRSLDAFGQCAEDDYVFSLEEQRHPSVDGGNGVSTVEISAGHVEIVGDHTQAPGKLIGLLQRHGIMKETQPERAAEFRQFLARLYGTLPPAQGLIRREGAQAAATGSGSAALASSASLIP